jgi:hypothetical protein
VSVRKTEAVAKQAGAGGVIVNELRHGVVGMVDKARQGGSGEQMWAMIRGWVRAGKSATCGAAAGRAVAGGGQSGSGHSKTVRHK